MTLDGAVIREQGVTFGIMVVKGQVLNDVTRRDVLVARASAVFGGIPTILMAQSNTGRARYYGRGDIVRFMANVPLAAVPWKRYRLAAGAEGIGFSPARASRTCSRGRRSLPR